MSNTLQKSSDTLQKSSDALRKSSYRLQKSSDKLQKSSDRLQKSSDKLQKSSDRLQKSSDRLQKRVLTLRRRFSAAEVLLSAGFTKNTRRIVGNPGLEAAFAYNLMSLVYILAESGEYARKQAREISAAN